MSEPAAGPVVDTGVAGKYIQYGDHIDTLETVDTVFKEQRKLSFAYGALFFGVTLAIPALTVWVEGWYAVPIWGGFTWNYLVVSLLYFAFLWIMAWVYAKQADRLDEKLAHMADAAAAELKSGGGVS